PGAIREQKRLAAVVLEDLGVPVIAAGITTIAGLLCLMTHIIVPAKQLGILGAIGITFALVCSLLFVPAVLAVLPVPPPIASLAGEARKGLLERGLARVADLVVARPK